MPIIPFICLFLFLSNKIFVKHFSAPMSVRVFKFCIHLERVAVYNLKENDDAKIYFAFLLPFPFFPSQVSILIGQLSVVHRPSAAVRRLSTFDISS